MGKRVQVFQELPPREIDVGVRNRVAGVWGQVSVSEGSPLSFDTTGSMAVLGGTGRHCHFQVEPEVNGAVCRMHGCITQSWSGLALAARTASSCELTPLDYCTAEGCLILRVGAHKGDKAL